MYYGNFQSVHFSVVVLPMYAITARNFKFSFWRENLFIINFTHFSPFFAIFYQNSSIFLNFRIKFDEIHDFLQVSDQATQINRRRLPPLCLFCHLTPLTVWFRLFSSYLRRFVGIFRENLRFFNRKFRIFVFFV